jgi:hypothetical protein
LNESFKTFAEPPAPDRERFERPGPEAFLVGE